MVALCQASQLGWSIELQGSVDKHVFLIDLDAHGPRPNLLGSANIV